MHEWRYVPRGLASERSCAIILPLAGIVIKAERYLPAVRPTGRLRKSVRNTACAFINRITRSTVASSRRSERPNLISSSSSSSRYFRMKSTGPTRGVVKGQYSVESARLTDGSDEQARAYYVFSTASILCTRGRHTITCRLIVVPRVYSETKRRQRAFNCTATEQAGRCYRSTSTKKTKYTGHRTEAEEPKRTLTCSLLVLYFPEILCRRTSDTVSD